MKKIITIGEILVEIMATEPGLGFREALKLVGPFASGAPAIFIDQVAKLGQPCGSIGCVGPDDFGTLNIERLRADGVDVSAVAVVPDAVTGSAFVRYRGDGERDFVFNIGQSASGRIALTAEARALVATADHVHVMGSALTSENIVEVTRAAIDAVKGKGGTVSFDPNIRKEMLAAPGLRDALEFVLGRTDLFLPSGKEIYLFTQAQDERGAIREILSRGVSAVVIKRGAEGATYVSRNVETHCPAFAVKEVDPTGAGDSFGATFVTCWLRGVSPKAALRLASASGARAVGQWGPMEGTPTQAELDYFLSQQPLGDAA